MAEPEMKEIKGAGSTMMLLGILQIVVGILAILAPLAAGSAVVWIIGIVLVVVGGAWLFGAFKEETFASGAVTFLGGLLYLVCGILVIMKPLAGLNILGTILMIFLFMRGILQVQGAFIVKPERGWGWLLFGGLLALLLGVLLMAHWPIAGMWAIGVFIGIELLFTGITVLLFGADLRDAAKTTGG
ncbi:MAG: HdeD family acid-resistance protein [Planctomycetota bacterium]